MDLKSCPDCATSYEGNFCPQCGQRYLATPYTIRFITASSLELFDFNRGFFFTLFYVLIKPGELIHDYLNGKTRRFNNPVRFLLTLIAFMAILDLIRTSGGEEEITVIHVVPAVLVLTIFTALYNYLVFRHKRGFAEHLIVSLYFSSAIFVVLSCITFLFLLTESFQIAPYSNEWSAGISVLCVLIFLFRFNFQVFTARGSQLVLKSLLYVVLIPAVVIACVYTAKMFGVL